MPPIDPNDPNVSNTTAQPTPQPAPYYDSGVSQPPNGGDVSSVSPAAPADASTPDEMVSNGPTNGTTSAPSNGPTNGPTTAPAAAAQPVHPSVARAGVIRQIAQVLGGGPTYQTSIDANSGAVTRTPVPLSGKQIALAIALESISGALSGMAQHGPNAVGAAGAAGLQAGQAIAQQRQEAQAQEDQNAQQGFKNQQATLAQKANAAYVNSQTIINTANAEKLGADMLTRVAGNNKDLIDAARENGSLDREHVTQDEIDRGMKDGSLHIAAALAPIDGYTIGPDGKIESTHAIIKDPNSKMTLTPEQYKFLTDNNVQGAPKLPAGTNIANFPMTVGQYAGLVEQANANHIAQGQQDKITKALQNSSDPNARALADVPSINQQLNDPKTGPGLFSALQNFSRYTSHSDPNTDIYQSLQKMAQPTVQDAQGNWVNNPNAKYADKVAQAYGGWNRLLAYHEQIEPLPIKNRNEAITMLNSSEPGSRKHTTAQGWLNTDSQQAAQEAAAKKGAVQSAKGTGGAGAGNQDANTNTLVDQIGTGHIVADRLGYLLTRNPSLLEEVSAKYPDFDSSKAATYPKTFQDFTSGKTSVALNAGGTALQHLYELLKLNTPASHIYGTPAYNAYQNKVDTVADELAKFYGNSTVSGIDSYKKTLNSTLPGNREAAIRTQAQSMGAKMDSYETTWKNAAPSPAYQQPMPGISPKAKAARAALDPDYARSQPPQGAIGKVPGSDGKLHWTDGKNDLGVAQ